MDMLKQRFKDKALALFQKNREMLKAHGDMVIGETKVSQLFGGMRGMKSMIWETSQLDAFEGIRFRGYSIPQLRQALPKAEGCNEPLPEGLFWLMLTGDLPTQEEVKWVTEEWKKRSEVPEHTFKMLESLPVDTHPMTQYSLAIVSMQTESIFARRYAEGLPKSEYWDAYYEDSMNLIASLPRLAAYIYRRTYHNGEHIAPDPSLDWGANFAHMLGISESPDFKSLMRLYLTIHADHEGGNASAHTTHLVGSTLSDPYYSLASGMNALAGPLHGLATQEVIKWILELTENIGTDEPTEEQLAEYITETLKSGKVIPGYGHAVLRKPDPRYMAQRRFAEEYIKDNKIVNIVWKLFSVVPPILEKWKSGKVKNPWPNVDAHSGSLLMHYGIKEFSYYTVMFGVSRAMGVLAAGTWSRALGMPIERPKSMTSEAISQLIANATVEE
ncbi:MAG: citrate (Si)-synthase [Saprospiraceae bacterium]|nr:citrate (Si)-synthase [Saprospiraceae bacterium]